MASRRLLGHGQPGERSVAGLSATFAMLAPGRLVAFELGSSGSGRLQQRHPTGVPSSTAAGITNASSMRYLRSLSFDLGGGAGLDHRDTTGHGQPLPAATV